MTRRQNDHRRVRHRFLYYGVNEIFKARKEIPEKVFGKPFEGGSISIENNPALLGVGYIIGPRIAAIMMGGGVLSYLVLIPAIKYFGGGLAAPVAPETGHTIAEMSVDRNPASLHSLYRRGCGRGGRNHQSRSLAAVDLARHKRRARRPAATRARQRPPPRGPIRIFR